MVTLQYCKTKDSYLLIPLSIFHVYKLIKIGNKTVSKIITKHYQIIQLRNQFNQSFIMNPLKHNIYKQYIATFQMNDCSKTCTHAPTCTLFTHYLLDNQISLLYKNLRKSYYYITEFLK